MGGADELARLRPARVLDGGDLDCGSGLALILRQTMLEIAEGEVLEMTSREGTVKDELPPWCRMVGHDYLGALPGKGHTRFFIRRGRAGEEQRRAVERDKVQAREYEWKTRVRATGERQARAYCRNFHLDVGQPASFDEKDEHPSAVEVLLSALGGSLAVGFATECSRAGLDVDDVELTVRGRLRNVLAHLGVEEGDPSFAAIRVKCFASTFADEDAVRAAWDRAVSRSPIAATLARATALELELALV